MCTGDETSEEWLGAQVFVVSLEVLLGGSHELDSYKLEAGLNVSQIILTKRASSLTRAVRSGR